MIVTVADGSEWVDLVVRWAGGHETPTRMRRPVGRLSAMGNHTQLLDEIRRLRGEGYTAEQISTSLNEDGWVTPTQKSSFNERLVRAMLHRHGSVPRGPKRPPSDDPNDIWLADLADELDMPVVTLYGWLRRGWIKGRRVNGQWAAVAGPQERQRLNRLRRRHVSPKRVLSKASKKRNVTGGA